MSTNNITTNNKVTVVLKQKKNVTLFIKDKQPSIIKHDRVVLQQQQHIVKTKKSQPKNNSNKKKSAPLPNTPQQQQKRNILPVKARRVERRKEIKSMTEEVILKNNNESSAESDDSLSSSNNNRKKNRYNKRHILIDVRDTIYAGPTFNNAPAPSALPLPIVITKKQKEDLSHYSKDLMNILSSQQSNFDKDLSEIQRGLRSMLKI